MTTEKWTDERRIEVINCFLWYNCTNKMQQTSIQKRASLQARISTTDRVSECDCVCMLLVIVSHLHATNSTTTIHQ